MLYTYEYLPHGVERLHQFIEHLVLNVWCTPSGPFDIQMLHPDFIPVVNGVKHKHLLIPISEIYSICIHDLSPDQLARLAEGFKANNDIEGLCNGTVDRQITYAEISSVNTKLSSKMKAFFKSLYTIILGLKPFYNCVGGGKIEEHYKLLVEHNINRKSVSLCPFCGLHGIKTHHQTKRDAYDHYLPKDKYPFSSVNFRNLAPACQECNSSYKTTKDPIFEGRGNRIRRTRAFFPFSNVRPDINIEITFNGFFPAHPDPSRIEVEVSSQQYPEETSSWSRVFGIQERYRAESCRPEARYWLEQLREYQNYGDAAAQIMETHFHTLRSNIWADSNFLKLPYLKAAHASNMI